MWNYNDLITKRERDNAQQTGLTGEQMRKEKKNPISDGIQKGMNLLSNILLVLLFCVMPLWFDKTGYGFIANAKWFLYSHVILPVLIVMLVGWVMDLLIADNGRSLHFQKHDYFMLLYLTAVVLSSMFADDKTGTVDGFYGWYMGLKSQISFVFIYYFVSRYWKPNRWIPAIAGILSSVIFILVILSRFWICPDILLTDLNEDTLYIFTGTIGNVDWVACYMAVILPFSAAIYQESKETLSRTVSGATYAIGTLAALLLGADSAILVLLLTIFLTAYRTEADARLYRFMEIVEITVGAFLGMCLLMHCFPNYMEIDALSMALRSYAVEVLIFFVLFGILYGYLKKHAEAERRIVNFVHQWLLKMALAGILGYLAYSLLNTFGLLPENLQTTNSYFVFNDAWGTLRGLLWRLALTGYLCMGLTNPMKFVVGGGPDQLWDMIQRYASDALTESGKTRQEQNAHNELVNTLCNYGILGLVGYLGMIVSLLRFYKKKENKTLLQDACYVTLIVYFVHSLISFQQVVTTPMQFALLGILASEQ